MISIKFYYLLLDFFSLHFFPSVCQIDLQGASQSLAQNLRASRRHQSEGPERAEHRGFVGRDLHHDDHHHREEGSRRNVPHHLQPYPESGSLAQGKKLR